VAAFFEQVPQGNAMPDDWIPQLVDVLEAVYVEWDRLAASYAFFGFAATILFAFGLMIAILLGR
jgi:hypothetical protein